MEDIEMNCFMGSTTEEIAIEAISEKKCVTNTSKKGNITTYKVATPFADGAIVSQQSFFASGRGEGILADKACFIS
jgi:hypothetical protein